MIFALALIYVTFGKLPLIEALFLGIKAAVFIIVIEALIRISKRALKGADHWWIVGLSFVAIFFFALPFPLIVLLAAAYGYLQHRSTSPPVPNPVRIEAGAFATTLRTVSIWLTVWLVPLILLAMIFGRDHVLADLAWFFSKLAVVTFGGAYAVLAYMGQDVVTHYNWLSAGEMMDALGLAETTPGPLILVTEFVGILAALRHGGEPAWLMALLGAFVSLWATFAPCFLWVFAGAPYIEWINGQARLKSALQGITAAVVGVILNLAVWFALHVLFRTVTLTTIGPIHLWLPDPATIDWRVVALASLSAVLLLWRHWSIPKVLGIAAAGALVMDRVLA